MTTVETQGNLPIGAIAAEGGLSIHTLRYYERIGLLAPVPRSASGHRRYSVATLERVEALSYLRASGMSVEDMRIYVANMELGDAAAKDHVALLEAHAQKLQDELEKLQVRHDYIAAKAAYWRTVAEHGPGTPKGDAHIARARTLSKQLRTDGAT